MNRAPRTLVAVLAIGPALGLLSFYVWPFGTLLVQAVDGRSMSDTLTRPGTWRVLWFTTWQAALSTVLTIAAGLAPAYVIARYQFAGRRLLVATLTALFVLPTVVMGAAFLALLPASIERTVWAVVAAHVVFNLAVAIRVIGAMWERLPADMEAAAATLGASRWSVFREISAPLLAPTIGGAAAMVFLFSFTSFGVIRILAAPGTRTIEVEVWRRATQLGDIGGAAVLSLVQLAVLAVVAATTVALQRRYSRALELRPGGRRARARGPRARLVVGSIAGATALVALAPLIALVIRSFSTPSGWSTSGWTTLGRAELRPGIRVGIDPIDALANSLEIAAWATLFAVVFGAAASLAIAAAGRAGHVLDLGLMLPVGTSAVTIGFGMLITFDAPPFDWRASWWLVPVGQALIAVPFVVRTTAGVLRSIDPALTDAAATLGASPTRAWREVVVPHLWRPLVVAAALAAAISLGEFGATSFLSRSGDETMPIAIEKLLSRTGSLLQAQGYALAAMLAAATIALVVAVDRAGDIVGTNGSARRVARR
jgi:thiamine transport system permease protein